MYVFDSMIDSIAERDGVVFPSKDHRTIFHKIVLCNPKYINADDVVFTAKTLCSVPQEKLRALTLGEVIAMGILV